VQISHSQIEQVLHALAEAKAGQPRGKPKLTTVQPGGKSPGGLPDEKIRQICRLIAAMPDTREDRLSEVMEALASGNYDPSSIEVAEKLLGRALADRLR
jgi:hypothetical protein